MWQLLVKHNQVPSNAAAVPCPPSSRLTTMFIASVQVDDIAEAMRQLLAVHNGALGDAATVHSFKAARITMNVPNVDTCGNWVSAHRSLMAWAWHRFLHVQCASSILDSLLAKTQAKVPYLSCCTYRWTSARTARA